MGMSNKFFTTAGSDGGTWANMLAKHHWVSLNKAGYSGNYLNSLKDSSALSKVFVDWRRELKGKAKGGTNVTKDFRKTGMFYNNKKRK